MLTAAFAAEAAAYADQFTNLIEEKGRRMVVRNSCHSEREVVTAAGAVLVRQPRVNEKHFHTNG